MKLTNEQLQKFSSLIVRLSPENLHMDGEASHREVRQRLNQIQYEWQRLEAQVGFQVHEEYIEGLMYK